MSKVHDFIAESKPFADIMEIGEGGHIRIDQKEAFNAAIDGTDLNEEAIKKHQDIRDRAIANFGYALGTKGNEAFNANPDLKQVSGSFKWGRDEIRATYKKSQPVPAREKGAEPTTAHGVLTIGYTANGQVGTRGSLKAVKSNLSSIARDMAEN